MERAYRTLRERLEEEAFTDLLQAKEVLAKVIRWYNEERLHSAVGYLPPVVYYRGNPKTGHDEKRRKLAEARHRRKEKNLKLKQRTIPFVDHQHPVAGAVIGVRHVERIDAVALLAAQLTRLVVRPGRPGAVRLLHSRAILGIIESVGEALVHNAGIFPQLRF